MSGPGAIACIGGGGFLVDDLRGVQERHLLTLLRPLAGRRPRVLSWAWRTATPRAASSGPSRCSRSWAATSTRCRSSRTR
jgi:hypothetical protein